MYFVLVIGAFLCYGEGYYRRGIMMTFHTQKLRNIQTVRLNHFFTWFIIFVIVSSAFFVVGSASGRSNSVVAYDDNGTRTGLLRTIQFFIEPKVRILYPTGKYKRLFLYGTQPYYYEKPYVSQRETPPFFGYFMQRAQPAIDVTVNAKNIMVTPDNAVVVSLYLTIEPLQEEIYIPQTQEIKNISPATQDAGVDYTVTLISGLQQEARDGALFFPKGRPQVLFIRAVMTDFEESGLYEFSFDSLAYEDRYKNVFHYSIPDTKVQGVYRDYDNTLAL